jgi:hypothetical protein
MICLIWSVDGRYGALAGVWLARACVFVYVCMFRTCSYAFAGWDGFVCVILGLDADKQIINTFNFFTLLASNRWEK